MAKKPSISKLKNKLWNNYFSPYIRLRDALTTTGTPYYAICCTCGKKYPAFGVMSIKKEWGVEVFGGTIQAGHFISGRGNSILFDEIGCNAQCYNCNFNLRGNWVQYEKFMLEKYGQQEVDRLKSLQGVPRKFQVFELEEMVGKYKNKIKILKDSYMNSH